MFSFRLTDSPQRFCVTSGVTAVFAYVLFLLVVWVQDPLGILRERRLFPGICESGIKVTFDRASIPALMGRVEAQEYFTGTSRIYRGFVASNLQPLASASTVVNAGLSGQLIEEAAQLLAPLYGRGTDKQLWIGLDFGMFLSSTPLRMDSFDALLDGPLSTWQIYWHGLFSESAARGALNIGMTGHLCGQLFRDAHGFIANESVLTLGRYAETPTLVDFYIARAFIQAKAAGWENYEHRMRIFERMLEGGVSAGHRIRLFINPSPPRFFKALEKAGVAEQYVRWADRVAAVADRVGAGSSRVQFHDFTSWYSDPESGLCRVDASDQCPFSDLTHYYPSVGQRIKASFH